MGNWLFCTWDHTLFIALLLTRDPHNHNSMRESDNWNSIDSDRTEYNKVFYAPHIVEFPCVARPVNNDHRIRIGIIIENFHSLFPAPDQAGLLSFLISGNYVLKNEVCLISADTKLTFQVQFVVSKRFPHSCRYFNVLIYHNSFIAICRSRRMPDKDMDVCSLYSRPEIMEVFT